MLFVSVAKMPEAVTDLQRIDRHNFGKALGNDSLHREDPTMLLRSKKPLEAFSGFAICSVMPLLHAWTPSRVQPNAHWSASLIYDIGNNGDVHIDRDPKDDKARTYINYAVGMVTGSELQSARHRQRVASDIGTAFPIDQQKYPHKKRSDVRIRAIPREDIYVTPNTHVVAFDPDREPHGVLYPEETIHRYLFRFVIEADKVTDVSVPMPPPLISPT